MTGPTRFTIWNLRCTISNRIYGNWRGNWKKSETDGDMPTMNCGEKLRRCGMKCDRDKVIYAIRKGEGYD